MGRCQEQPMYMRPHTKHTKFRRAIAQAVKGVYLVGFAHAQHTLLLELELAHQVAVGAVDAHGAPMVHIDLANDQVVDAGHNLPSIHVPGITIGCRCTVDLGYHS